MTVTVKPLAVDLEHAAAMVALSESTWQSLVREGKAPAPRMLSGRRVAWLVKEIEAWLEARPVSDLAPPPNTGAKKPRRHKGFNPPSAG